MKFKSLLILLLIMMPLSASTLKIGIYDKSTLSFSSDITQAINLLLQSDNTTAFFTLLNREKDERLFNISEEVKKHNALSKETNVSERGSFVYLSYLDEKEKSNISMIERTSTFDEFLFESKTEAGNYLLSLNDLDIAFLIEGEKSGQVASYSLYAVTYNEIRHLGDSLYLLTEPSSRFESILKLLASYIAPNAGFVRFVSAPPNSVFFVDSVKSSPQDRMLLLTEGEHSLEIFAPGYENYSSTLVVNKGQLTSLKIEMVRSAFTPITFSALPPSSLFYFAGLDGVKMPFTLEEATYPLIATVSSDGYLSSTIQLNSSSALHEVKLRPEWMGSDERVTDAKKAMYRSFRNTLISLGAVAAVGAIEAVYSSDLTDNNIYMPIKAVTIGISVVSLFDLVRNLAIYYNTAKETYL